VLQQIEKPLFHLLPLLGLEIDGLHVLQNVVKEHREDGVEMRLVRGTGHEGGGPQRMQHGHGAETAAFVAVSAEQVTQRFHEEAFAVPVSFFIRIERFLGEDVLQHVVAVQRRGAQVVVEHR